MSEGFDSATMMKVQTAKQKKDTADQAFKNGDLTAALRAYYEALLFLKGLDKNALKSIGIGASSAPAPSSSTDGKDAKEKTEIDDLEEKIHSNMAAVHIKKGTWHRAVDAADKALAKNENNYKAMFRKGKALGEQGFIERATKLLEEVKEKNPADTAAVDAELARLKVLDKERDKVSKQKLKGFLNKAEKRGDRIGSPEKKKKKGGDSAPADADDHDHDVPTGPPAPQAASVDWKGFLNKAEKRGDRIGSPDKKKKKGGGPAPADTDDHNHDEPAGPPAPASIEELPDDA